MSAEHGHGEHESHRPVSFYLAIAAFLTVVTAFELGPLFDLYRLPALLLLALSAVKFFVVVAFFMHLWDDAQVYTRLFAAPLIGSSLMVGVLMVLHHTFSPSPVRDSVAVAERYGDTWNQPCNAWVRSGHSHRWYCSSPPIDDARVAALLPNDQKPKSAIGDGADAGVDLTAMNDADKKAFLIKKGESEYGTVCLACHQASGLGVPGAFPPLAGSDYIVDSSVHVKVILNGLAGPVKVNGVDYNGAMQAWGGSLSDLQIAAIATYERNAWGNDLGVVLPEQVKALR